MNFVGIIPARYASTRFPGKPLALIGGKTMIERVYCQAKKTLDNVYVATDDSRILNAVLSFGGQAIMTSEHHRSGTDRVFEALTKIDKKFDIVVNIQGDEPFIKPEQIETLCNCFSTPETDIATLVKPFSTDDNLENLKNFNTPKVIFNEKMQAIYFSRSVVPFLRGVEERDWLKKHTFYKHIGIYAYHAEVLAKITQLPPSPLEIAESLEQLRWLENGFAIRVGIATAESYGIDTPEDLEKIYKKISLG